MNDSIEAAQPKFREARTGLLSRISVVWLVPALALAISLGVAWQSYSDQGVLIEVAFENASGVEEGKTQLRYRDVSVGTVESVSFSDDLSNVIAYIRVDKDVAPYIDAQAKFWVVRPQVSVRGISGLGTVLAGVHIEGSWDAVIETPADTFAGLSAAPLVGPGINGIPVVLSSREGKQLTAGAPILYKGIRVGVIEAPRLTDAGNEVITNGFIEAPYDALVTSETRFWYTSGFKVSFGASGINLDVDSLASLVEGGLTFDTMVSGGTAIEPGESFPIFESEDAARKSLFQGSSTNILPVMAEFDGSVRGLVAGAEVRFRGIKVGEVGALSMNTVTTDRDRIVRLRAVLELNPGNLGLGREATQEQVVDLLRDYVAQGLRARLTSANILTGELIVELVDVPEAEPASLDLAAEPYPLVPSVEANLSDFNATAEGVFERINALKVEELIASAISVLDGANGLSRSEGAATVLPELTGTLEEARLVLSELREAGASAKLNSVLSSAEGAAKAIETAADQLPDLTSRLETLTARTETVLSSYDESSRLISTSLATLRDISEAAEALKSLARTLQRNPNSIILGR
jgi:paraquat-inducible protein B